MKKVMALGLMVVLLGPAESDARQPVHIAIEGPDVDALGGWPLDRKWYAVALQNLKQGGARRVFIDIAFPKADLAHPESDEFFFHELQAHDDVFVLATPQHADDDSVQILGHYALPQRRAFMPFSASFSLRNSKLVLHPAADGALVHALLPPTLPDTPLLIDLPRTSLPPDHSFLEAIHNRLDVAGRDVLISLDYPGVTSYVVPGDGQAPMATAALQRYAAQQIHAGAFYVPWPAWKLGLCFLLAWIPLLLLVRRRTMKGVLGCALLSLLFGLGMLWGLPAAGVYVPPVWYGTLLVPLGLLVYGALRTTRRPAPAPRAPESSNAEDSAELDTLRYKLQFYENLEAPTPTDDPTADADGILFHPDSPLVGLLRKARQIAQSDMPVLILGESGTGKEMLARYLHAQSTRASKPFVAVNCASFNENLIESELFGHEAGAFTGATRRKIGRFERADGGTLFLDEIAETSAAVQVKLLRVLQEGVIERVGGTDPLSVSVRVIAATHQNLQTAIGERRFREDLYYRLHGVSLHLPPLRERPMDIEHLFRAFVQEQQTNLRVSPALLDWLREQPWPGNVRELRAATERAVLNAQIKNRSFLVPRDFELEAAATMPTPSPDELADKVLAGLRHHCFAHGSISTVAEELSIHRVTVTEYLRGWVIRYMYQYDLDQAQVSRALRGNAGVDDERAFEARVGQYMSTIRKRILKGVDRNETDNEIWLGRFKNTQSEFEDDLKQLIQTLRTVLQ